MLLPLSDHEVRTAHDGPTGLAAAAEFQPDLILLDIGMPGTTGYDMVRGLRATPEFKATTLAAMTGWGQGDDRRQSREAGSTTTSSSRSTRPLSRGSWLRPLPAPAADSHL